MAFSKLWTESREAFKGRVILCIAPLQKVPTWGHDQEIVDSK